jgi:TRAP-type C4-dicarboxylate transport system substrate-binding protein
MTRNQKVVLKSMAAAVAFASIGGAVQAQEVINLTFLSGFPPASTNTGAFVSGYAPAVDATLAKTGNFKINWNMAHSGQIVKPRGELEGLETGLGEIGIVVNAFHADKLPLHDISFKTPFTTRNMDLIARTTKSLMDKYPAFQADWDNFNQIALFPTGAVDNYFIISSQPLKHISDLKGRKVGAAGPNLPWVTAVGAAGVQTNLADAYNSLQTGIYDNMVVWAQAIGAFKLCEPAPHVFDVSFGANQSNMLSINTDTLSALPDEVRRAIVDNVEVWHVKNDELLTEGAAKGLNRCKTEFKATVTTVPDDQRKEWARLLPPLARDWAKAMDAAGKPGTQILNDYMATMRAANQPLLRQWDKE